MTMVADHRTITGMESVAISEFKARCLAILDKVRRTGQPILVTRRGEPVAEVAPPSAEHHEGNWLGRAAGTGRILGDIVAPATAEGEWEALR